MTKVSQEKYLSYTLIASQVKFVGGKPYWNVKKKGVKIGSVAGSLGVDGYRRICIAGVSILAHRAMWFICNGDNPDLSIDHIDGNKDNNNLSNLRVAEAFQNQSNMKKPITNKSGFKGVYMSSGGGKPFCAQVKHKGIKYHLGRFSTAIEAKQAYDKKAAELHLEFYRYE